MRSGNVTVRIEGLKPNEAVTVDQKVITELSSYQGNDLNSESRIHSIEGLKLFQELRGRNSKVILDFN